MKLAHYVLCRTYRSHLGVGFKFSPLPGILHTHSNVLARMTGDKWLSGWCVQKGEQSNKRFVFAGRITVDKSRRLVIHIYPGGYRLCFAVYFHRSSAKSLLDTFLPEPRMKS